MVADTNDKDTIAEHRSREPAIAAASVLCLCLLWVIIDKTLPSVSLQRPGNWRQEAEYNGKKNHQAAEWKARGVTSVGGIGRPDSAGHVRPRGWKPEAVSVNESLVEVQLDSSARNDDDVTGESCQRRCARAAK